ncbi:MAG: ATP-binding protein [Pseudomonadales bacterium]
MKLDAQQLIRHIHPEDLNLDKACSPPTANQILGQPRATEALELGIRTPQPGYNLYLAGDSGTGRVRYVMDYLAPLAAIADPPQDWLYVNNFDNPSEPRAIALPHKQGSSFLKDIDKLIEEILATFPAVFEHPTYLRKKTAIQKEFDQIYDQSVATVEQRATAMDIAVYRQEGSITFSPLVDGEIADENSFAKLSEEKREAFHRQAEELENMLNDSLMELPQWQRDLNNKLRKLQQETIRHSLKPLFDQIQNQYLGYAGILLYLAQVNDHLPRTIVEHLDAGEQQESPGARRMLLEELYRPNLFSAHRQANGAPIIFETNPSYNNLFGSITVSGEQSSQATSYHNIIPGSLHHANGGYLILDIEKVLRDPSTWEALKRALLDGKIYIEQPSSELQLGLPQHLKAKSIPLNIKVILIGPREVYYALEEHDYDFDQQFRILVDFSSDIDFDDCNLTRFANHVQGRADDLGLAQLNASALSRLAEHACRLAENQNKLTACMDPIMEVVTEANQFLLQSSENIIDKQHIENAINARTRRNSRLHDLVKEDILSGKVVISTEGSAVGQVNGLSVIQVGESSFGLPVRITATVHPGSSGVVDIEREVELGQAVHSKGVLLLAGYLCGRYAKNFPLAISAKVAMEQSYGYIDGDSASLAELCALLSALIVQPVKQNIAMTGSVNQRGEVQAIGGVNEKIEGFFDICKMRGLTGDQVVIIPASNQSNLMLSNEVIEAVEQGLFSIHAISKVDEALALLTGENPGNKDSKGEFPEGSINKRIVDQLRRYTEIVQQFQSRT